MGLNTIDSGSVHLVLAWQQRWRRLTRTTTKATAADHIKGNVTSGRRPDWSHHPMLYRVYDALGFGFLESVYRQAMMIELANEGLTAVGEAATDVWYRERKIGRFRADILVEGRVIVEIKASELLPVDAQKQLLNDLRASKVEVGLLLHFGPKAKFQRLIHSNPNKLHQTSTS